MILKTYSIIVLLTIVTTVTTAYGQTGAPALSDTDCALLLARYGVTPPSCTSSDAASVMITAAHTTSPTNSAHLPQLTDETRRNHVFFPAGGTTLDDSARAQLMELLALLIEPSMNSACLRLVGHSDRSGTAAANQILSMQRAQTVAAFLSAVLGDVRIAEIAGAGFNEPLQDFAPSANENRRVAIFLGPCPALKAQ